MAEDKATRVSLELEGSVATITLNRPDALNALDTHMLRGLEAALGRAAADERARAVVLTGAGRGFCAGADVKEWAAGDLAGPSEEAPDDWVTMAHRLVARLYRLPKPVIAAVNGVAVGAGLDLALAADFRIAADAARFGSVYIKIGIPPDAGASFLLPRIVGMSKAKELIYTGRIIDAAEAERIGLVSEVVPVAQLGAAAAQMAGELAAGPTVAIGMAKENLQENWTSTIESALRAEQRAARLCETTEDHAEGLRAVNEKRPPEFKGR